ncbi:MAG: type II toxin-antitoxin system PemK/MazF family toxin, partial [Candidatus Sulfotelmatobacter sp.]
MPEVLRGDVFTVSLEPVQGSEQGGTRPVVVVSRDALNKFSPV